MPTALAKPSSVLPKHHYSWKKHIICFFSKTYMFTLFEQMFIHRVAARHSGRLLHPPGQDLMGVLLPSARLSFFINTQSAPTQPAALVPMYRTGCSFHFYPLNANKSTSRAQPSVGSTDNLLWPFGAAHFHIAMMLCERIKALDCPPLR